MGRGTRAGATCQFLPHIFPAMPIYEYHCPDCHADFELFIRGETTVACPSCESRKIERRMSLPARPAGGTSFADYTNLGPPKSGGGGCGGGGCGCH